MNAIIGVKPEYHGPPICQMCGETPHLVPQPAAFGMTCPGDGATPEAAKAFMTERTYRTEVAAAYGPTLASSNEYMTYIAKRSADAKERLAAARAWNAEHPDHPELNLMRSDVTPEVLAKHAAALTPTTMPPAPIEPQQFEPKVNMLRVPQKDLSRRGSRLETPNGGIPTPSAKDMHEAANIPDSAMFLFNSED